MDLDDDRRSSKAAAVELNDEMNPSIALMVAVTRCRSWGVNGLIRGVVVADLIYNTVSGGLDVRDDGGSSGLHDAKGRERRKEAKYWFQFRFKNLALL